MGWLIAGIFVVFIALVVLVELLAIRDMDDAENGPGE